MRVLFFLIELKLVCLNDDVNKFRRFIRSVDVFKFSLDFGNYFGVCFLMFIIC